ncbi:MAG: hypothetical protein WDO12_10525 [Pseudomonadota bacterium]
MNTQNGPDEFETRAAALLRASVEDMDGTTRARLARARAAALEPAHARSWFGFRYLAPAGATAAAVLATLLFVGGRHHQTNPVNEGAGTALYDMDLLADADGLDIAQESDLDFIEWAASQGEQSGAGG